MRENPKRMLNFNIRPNFSAMQAQAKTVQVVQAGDVSPFVDLSKCTVQDELNKMKTPGGYAFNLDVNTAGPKFEVIDGHVALENTELFYPVPSNTTLVEVLGPAGTNPGWRGAAECYAFLNPRPSWWLEGNFPISVAWQPLNATNQTMFLLPIDPEIQYEVRVGTLGNETTCPVSAIRSYPFH